MKIANIETATKKELIEFATANSELFLEVELKQIKASRTKVGEAREIVRNVMKTTEGDTVSTTVENQNEVATTEPLTENEAVNTEVIGTESDFSELEQIEELRNRVYGRLIRVNKKSIVIETAGYEAKIPFNYIPENDLEKIRECYDFLSEDIDFIEGDVALAKDITLEMAEVIKLAKYDVPDEFEIYQTTLLTAAANLNAYTVKGLEVPEIESSDSELEADFEMKDAMAKAEAKEEAKAMEAKYEAQAAAEDDIVELQNAALVAEAVKEPEVANAEFKDATTKQISDNVRQMIRTANETFGSKMIVRKAGDIIGVVGLFDEQRKILETLNEVVSTASILNPRARFAKLENGIAITTNTTAEGFSEKVKF